VSWQRDALCRQVDPDCFFPSEEVLDNTIWTLTKKFCRGCEVRAECLTYALTEFEGYGVWGGFSPHDRTQVRKEIEVITVESVRAWIDEREGQAG
jgi:WhiB family redox-sensing transcriptional regulator